VKLPELGNNHLSSEVGRADSREKTQRADTMMLNNDSIENFNEGTLNYFSFIKIGENPYGTYTKCLLKHRSHKNSFPIQTTRKGRFLSDEIL